MPGAVVGFLLGGRTDWVSDAEGIQKSPNLREVSGFLGPSLKPDTKLARSLRDSIRIDRTSS